MAVQGKVVRHYHKEWVVRAWRGDWEASWLGGHLTYTGHEASPHLDDVWVHSRPEDCFVNPSGHTRDSLVSSMNAYQDLGSQGCWDHDAISVAQDSIYYMKVVLEPVVLPQR